MEREDKLLIAKIEDLFSMCDKYCSARFSGFLDGAEQSVISDSMPIPYGYNVLLYGGFDDAEKKIMGVFPEWETPDIGKFPISCLKIEGGFSRRLTHRDYLGTIMSLGLVPSKLGDIVVSGDLAYVFLCADIAGYTADNLHKIGNQGVKVTIVDDLGGLSVERQYKTIRTVCASGRLDALVAAAAGISRSAASGLIEAGKIKVNHRGIYKTAEAVKEGDLLSIRGHGRFLVYQFGGETRSSRRHVILKQYI